jgi:hypothetical protein
VTAPVSEPESAEETEPGEETEPETFTAADRAALKKALASERKMHREVAAKLTQIEAEKLTDTDKAWTDKVTQVTADAEGRLKLVAARHALASAGLQGKPDRLVRLLDLTEVSVDEDGVPVGLDDQIKQMQVDFPGLFGEKAQAPPGHLDIGGKRPPAARPKSFAEQVAATIPGLS